MLHVARHFANPTELGGWYYVTKSERRAIGFSVLLTDGKAAVWRNYYGIEGQPGDRRRRRVALILETAIHVGRRVALF